MKSINNFREYSQYKTKDGKSLKRGMLYRSASIHKASKEDLLELERLNIGYLLDFRSYNEILEKPDKEINNCKYIHVARDTNEIKKFEEYKNEVGFTRLLPSGSKEAFSKTYEQLPFKNDCIQTLFNVLLENDGRAVLHHCAAGKDRAGVAAAVVLKTLGVSDEVIIEDYLKSQEYYSPLMDDIFSDATKEDREKYEPMIHYIAVADVDYIKLALSKIDEKYPTFDEYLLNEYGIDSIKKSILLDKYVEG